MFGRRQFSTHKGLPTLLQAIFSSRALCWFTAAFMSGEWSLIEWPAANQYVCNIGVFEVRRRKANRASRQLAWVGIALTLGINLQSGAIHLAFVSSNSASVQVKLVKDSFFLYPPTPCLFLCPSLSPSRSILDDKIPRCWLNPEYDNLPVSKVRLSLELSVCMLVCCWRQARSCNKNNCVLISAVHSANMPIIHPKEDYVRQSTMPLCTSVFTMFTSTFYTQSNLITLKGMLWWQWWVKKALVQALVLLCMDKTLIYVAYRHTHTHTQNQTHTDSCKRTQAYIFPCVLAVQRDRLLRVQFIDVWMTMRT